MEAKRPARRLSRRRTKPVQGDPEASAGADRAGTQTSAPKRARRSPARPQPVSAAHPAPELFAATNGATTSAALPVVGTEPAGRPWSEESFVMPPAYGDTRIAILVKDPWWTYAWWEVTEEVRKELEGRLPAGEGWRPALRVWDVTEARPGPTGTARFFDVSVSSFVGNWFLHTDAPSRSFVVDIGFLEKGGQFVAIARSNRITSPRLGPSEVVDEEWMSSEETYWRLFGATAGVGIGSSPMEIRRVLEQQLSSGAVASPTAPFSQVTSPMVVPKERIDAASLAEIEQKDVLFPFVDYRVYAHGPA